MASATLGRFFAFLLALNKSVPFRRRLPGYVATQGKAHSLAACLSACTAVLACTPSWALVPQVAVAAYSSHPGGMAYGSPERSTPQAHCVEINAPQFVQAALNAGWKTAWLISTEVIKDPSPDYSTLWACTVKIGHCLADGFCSGSSTRNNIWGVRRPGCPAGSSSVTGGCQCDLGYQEDATQTSCIPAIPEPPSLAAAAPICRVAGRASIAGELVGAPVAPATGDKSRSEIDLVVAGSGTLTFARSHHSAWGLDAARRGGSLGKAWSHNHETSLKTTASDSAGAATAVAISFSEGFIRTFSKVGGAQEWTATNGIDTLSRSADQGWTYRRADDDSTFIFDASGKLQAVSRRNGWTHSYTYNAAGQLASIFDNLGHGLNLVHDGGGKLLSVSTLDGRQTGYAYDTAGRLLSVTYPDGKTRRFVYENAYYPQALTGIFDESGVRWGTFAYDAQGRATSTELAGAVNRYQVSYPVAGTATVIDPLSTSRNYSYSAAKGKLAVTGGSLPSGEGESDAASRVQDANGLITSETDFNGIRTDTTWDVARRLPISVTRAVGTPEAQTVTTQWHATFSLPVLVTESGRTTAYSYDDKGNVLSQAITDTSSSPNTTRTTQWTWNTQGLAATETAPNGAVTTFEYDPLGNLVKFTNALGHVTQYSYDTANSGSNRLDGFGQTTGGTSTNVTYAYNANGDLTSDGLRTYSYDAEGRLSAVTTGATDTSPTTRYAHNALGQRVFKTEPLYPPAEGDESDPGFFQGLLNFFTKLWGPNTTDAEKLGFAFMYDEDGTLLAETGMGGANSAGSTQYIYLPTAGGPMPVAAVINGQLYAVHSDHLNTPRRLTDSNGQAVWQWAYSAFGDTKPTTAHNRFADLDLTPNPGVTSFAEFVFNLRWPGQYYDKESGLHYNGFRSLDPRTGQYTQNDRIGLAGGANRRTYVGANPLRYTDATGLAPECEWVANVLRCRSAPLPIDPDNPSRGSTLVPWPKLVPQPLVDACDAAVNQLKNWMFSNGPGSPTIDPSDVAGKAPGAIDQLAKDAGLLPKGPDPQNGRGAYVDPVTGEQRILVHGDHAHVNDSGGNRLDVNGRQVPPNSPDAHLPIKP